MNKVKGLLVIALTFALAACASIPENIKGNNQSDIQKKLYLSAQPTRVIYRSAGSLWG